MTSLSPKQALIFRMTHRANLPWILEHGLDCASAERRNPSFVEIGSADLIAKRRTREVSIPPHGTLADYIPFYFTPSSPMLFNIKTGHGVPQLPMEDVVVLVTSLPQLQQRGVPFVFTDRHAYLRNASYYRDQRISISWIGHCCGRGTSRRHRITRKSPSATKPRPWCTGICRLAPCWAWP